MPNQILAAHSRFELEMVDSESTVLPVTPMSNVAELVTKTLYYAAFCTRT